MPTHRAIPLLTRSLASAALLCAAFAIPAIVSAQQPYRILDRWKIGGDGFWDDLHVDSPAHRLYLTHGARVDVLDTQTGKLVGAITGLHGTHGVALDDAGKFGYISDGGGNAVVVFDRATLATVATIPAGQNPDGIVFEPVTQTVWAFNGRSQDITVISAARQKVVATIPLPGRPEFPAVDGQGAVFDNIEDKNEIVRIDARSKSSPPSGPSPDATAPAAWLSTRQAHASFPSVITCAWPSSAPTTENLSPRPSSARVPTAPATTPSTNWPSPPAEKASSP